MSSAREELEGIIANLSEAETRNEKVEILKSLVKDEDYFVKSMVEKYICDDSDGGDSDDSSDDSDDVLDDEYYLNLVLLLIAVLKKKSDWAKHLIKKRDVDPSEHLRLMLQNGYLGLALFLMEAGADVNSISPEHKCQLLTAAARVGSKRRVDTLVRATADVNNVDSKGNTPLLLGVKKGYNQCVKLLMKSGPDVNNVDKNGNTPLLLEGGNSFHECVNLLIKSGADVNIADRKMNTPLMYAAPNDVETLLKAGADVNATNSGGVTALMVKARNEYDLSVRRLLEAGANVNIVDNVGETALTTAVYFGHKNCAKHLIDAGADVNHENNVGDTVLITAAWSGKPELVRILLEAGAHVHKTNNRGQNALTCHVAQCEIFSEELASMLVAAGEVLYISQEKNNGKRVARYGSSGVIAHIKVPDILLSNRLCHFKQLPDSPSGSLTSGEKGDSDGNNDGEPASRSSFASNTDGDSEGNNNDDAAIETAFAPDTDGDEDAVISSSDAVVGNVQEESNMIKIGDDVENRTTAKSNITVAAESDEEDGDGQNAEVAGVPKSSTAVTAVNKNDDDIKTCAVDVDIIPTIDTGTDTGEKKSNATLSGIENEPSRPDARVPVPFYTDSNKVTNVSDAATEYCVNTTWSDMPGTNLSTSVTNHTASGVGESGVSPAVERSKAKSLSDDTSADIADDDSAMDATKDANTPQAQTSGSANTHCQGGNKEKLLARAETIELYDDNSLTDNGGDVNKESDLTEGDDVSTSCAKSSGKRSHSDAFSNDDEYDDDSGAAHSDGDASNISNTSDGSSDAVARTDGVEGEDSKENFPRKRFRCTLM